MIKREKNAMQKQKAAKLIGIGFTVILMMGGCSGNAAAPSRESISEEIVVEKAENGNYIEGESGEKSAEKSREEEETGKLYGEKSAEGAEAGKLSGEKNDGDVPENENKAVSNSTDGKYSRLYEMYDYDESEWTGYSPTLLLDYNIPEDYVQFTCDPDLFLCEGIQRGCARLCGSAVARTGEIQMHMGFQIRQLAGRELGDYAQWTPIIKCDTIRSPNERR